MLLTLTLLISTAHSATLSLSEPFDTATASANDGWLGMGNTSDGNSYGWSGTAFSGGPSGEAGGLFNHGTNMSFYAVPLGGTFDLSATYHGTGSVAVTSSGNRAVLNDYIAIGFCNTNRLGGGQSDLLGITIQEFGTGAHTNDWRGRTGINFDTVDRFDAGGTVWYMPSNYNGAYTFSFDYNPTNGGYGQITATLWKSGVSQGTFTGNLSAAQRAYGGSFNAFGLATGGMTDPNVAGNFFNLYVDNLSGTVTGTNTAINHSPLPGTVSTNTAQGALLTLSTTSLLAQASDPDGDPLALLSVVSPSTNGAQVTLSATNTVVYQPTPNYLGLDAFSYSIGDGHGGFATGTVAVAVYGGQNRLSLVRSNNWPAVFYSAIPSNTYTIQRSPALSPAAWSNVAVVSADAFGRVTFVDTNPPSPSAFYRAAIGAAPVYTNWIGVNYSRRTFYHSPQTPGYTCWVGAWQMQDDSLMVMCHQATGPIAGRTNAHYDYSGLTLANEYFSSTNHGINSVKTAEELFVSDSDRAAWGGSHCPLPDGGILRAVDGSALPSNNVPRRIFLQRSYDLGQTWSPPELPPEPTRPAAYSNYIGDFADCITRIRPLPDGRLLATGVKRYDPNPPNRLYGEPVFMFSSDNGTNWTQQHIVLSGIQTNYDAWDEWDCAPLPSGDFLGVFRRTSTTNSSVQVRYQGRFHNTGGTNWIVDQYGPAPFPHSGHPELLAAREGIILHIATSGISWTADGGATWQTLTIPGLGTYTSDYYPRSVQLRDGWICVASHAGSDNWYGQVDQSVILDTFRLQGQ